MGVVRIKILIKIIVKREEGFAEGETLFSFFSDATRRGPRTQRSGVEGRC
jgi:hypothetical protein